jgi:peptidyl-prolyl cis-trans isomerase C
MKAIRVFVLAAASVAWAQILPTMQVMPEIPGGTVLAVFDDGVKFTMDDFRSLYTVMNPQMQESAMKNREEWIKQYALLRKLAKLAEQDKLHLMSPTKDAIEFNRLLLLSQVELNAHMNGTTVEGADIVKFYDENRERFKQVNVKVIYISFTPEALAQATSSKGLSESAAKAKAEKLLAQIRGGADFVAIAKANSDDQTSREKDGDFGILRRTDNIPDKIRDVVFSLKKGEVSEPVRQPNGFYILKAADVTYRPLSEVRDEVYNDVKMKLHENWLKTTREQATVSLQDPTFFAKPAAQPAAPAK